MKNGIKLLGIITFYVVIGLSFIACDFLFGDSDGTGIGSSGNTRETARLVTVGYSSSNNISSSGEHWFRFVGTGNPVIFETRGNTVATEISVWIDNQWMSSNYSSSGGEGSNALVSRATNPGTNYFIQITARNSTFGTYTFVVE